MSNTIVDVVNFNADASCFSSDRWLNCLEGGRDSKFCRWLYSYVEKEKKVSLGLIGATVADLKEFNPEAIEIINIHQEVFEVILRPWSHDVGVYRSDETFMFNVRMGIEIIQKEFKKVSKFFLPPEFMINSRQIELLREFSVEAIFINSSRYDRHTAERVPTEPYYVAAISGNKMPCISINGDSSKGYLKSIQMLDASFWNNCVANGSGEVYFSWRDGESAFLIPDGVFREKFWLEKEDKDLKRVFLCELPINYTLSKNLLDHHYKSYPIHSFLSWMKEMKMLWFISHVSEIEKRFTAMSLDQRINFLHLINSDILSSVEKGSPTVDLSSDGEVRKYTIYRQEKGFEGEQLLAMYYKPESIDLQNSLFKKCLARNNYLKNLLAANNDS